MNSDVQLNLPLDLPTGWAQSTIGDVTEKTVEQHEPYGDTEFLYVDISSIDNQTKIIAEPKLLPIDEAPSRARQHLKLGDVLVSMTRPYLNAVALLPESMAGAIGSTGLYVLRTRWILPAWLFYIVQTSDFVETMSSLVQGALYPAVRPRDIDSYEIPVAPLAEQHRIVAEIEKQLSRLDSSVNSLERVRIKLKRNRDSVLRAACAGSLVPGEAELARKEGHHYKSGDHLLEQILHERRAKWETEQLSRIEAQGKAPKDDKWREKYQAPNPPDTTDLPDLPEGWTWTNLDQLKVFSLYGPRFSSEDYAPSGYYVLRTTDISESGKVNIETSPRLPLSLKEFEKYRLHQGDLLITRTGSIGTLAVFDDIVDAIPGAYLILYRLAAPRITGWYIFYYLKSPIGQEHLVGGSSGVGRLNLNAPTIESLPIPLPPLAEQHRIISEIERRLSVIEGVETVVEGNLRRAEMLRQRILKHAFEGKLVPQDRNDEPASALLDRIRAEKVQLEQEAEALSKAKRSKMVSSKQKPKAKRIKVVQRRPLIEVLSEMNRQLTPEDLFTEAGFDADDITEPIDAFYKELGEAVKKKLIKEVRPNNTDVYLEISSL
jgi:type I restriction enzyme S subunit